METTTIMPAVVLLGLGLLLIGLAFWLWRKNSLTTGVVPATMPREDLQLYTVMHDLSNPLQDILITLENIAGYAHQQDQRLTYDLESIHKAIRDLVEITENTKLLSVLDSTTTSPHRTPIDIVGVVQDCILTTYPRAQKEGVDIHYGGPDGSPPIWGNKSEMKRVITNLIDNGIKYRNPNVEQAIIKIDIRQEQNQIRVEVADNGIGISAAQQQKLWESPFQPRDARTIGIKGSGLGLYTVQRIISKYQGAIEVESREGHGTTFTLIFPFIPNNTNKA